MATTRPKQPILDKWYHSLWVPSCAAIYLIICIFDFLAMPVYTAYANSQTQATLIAKLDPKDMATFADDIIKSVYANHQWNPITLMGSGLFHLSFGSILGAAAATRGLAKKSEVEGYFGTLNGAPVEPQSIPRA